MTTPSIGRANDLGAAAAALVAQRFGAANVVTGAAELAKYEVDGMQPAAAVMAASTEEIVELLRLAVSEKLAVIPCAGRTKLGIGAPPAKYDVALDLSRMNRVLAYEPRDLTLGVEPGVRLSDLLRKLAGESQFLPLLPPFLERATIGGILATDSLSPLRQAYGGPRDFVLGMEFVTGYGSAAKSGGRVVKNVSGYDLHKLLIGSLGTLAVITRANFKTFPVPSAQGTFAAAFEDAAKALEFCGAVRQSALTPIIVEVISPDAGQLLVGAMTRIGLPEKCWCAVVSAAGNERVVERHARELAALADQSKAGGFVALRNDEGPVRLSASLLGNIRDFPFMVQEADPKAAIFRIAVVPGSMAALAQKLAIIAAENGMPAAMVLFPHGLVSFALTVPRGAPPMDISVIARAAEQVFRVAVELGAKARIEFAPTELKRKVNVWGTPRPDFELMARVKKVFDPEGVLSPGRFAGGI